MTKRLLFVVLVMTLITGFAIAGGDEEEAANVEAMQGYTAYSAAGINVQLKVEGDSLHVQMSAKTTGWVSVGFDPSRMMKDANIIIGYIENGKVELRDDFGTRNTAHGADVDNGGVSNLSNVEGEESDGVTTIRFSIPLDSGDATDKPLNVGSSYKMIVASGPDGKDDFGSYHGDRGSVEIDL